MDLRLCGLGRVVEMREWIFREVAGETIAKEGEKWLAREETGGVR